MKSNENISKFILFYIELKIYFQFLPIHKYKITRINILSVLKTPT